MLLGNVIGLLGSILLIYTGFIKEKKRIIYVQSIQITFFVISNLILGGITGAIVNVISLFRNILCYNEKLNKKNKILISIVVIFLSVLFNNYGLIGFLPLISTITYLWLINIKDVIKFKYLVIFTMIMWGIYDLTIKCYTCFIFDMLTILSNLYSIYKIKKKKTIK